MGTVLTDNQSMTSSTRPLFPESNLTRNLRENSRLREQVSELDFEVIDEFSATLKRLKKLMKAEDANRLEESLASIEQVVGGKGPVGTRVDEPDEFTSEPVAAGSDVGHKRTDVERKISQAEISEIESSIDGMLGEINSWVETDDGARIATE